MAREFETADERISSTIQGRNASNSLFLATNVAGLIDVLQYEKASFIKLLVPEGKKDEK